MFDLHYLQLADETSAAESLNVYRAVRKDFPELKLCPTPPSEEARPFLNLPCPLTPGFNSGWRDEIRRAGRGILVVCLSCPADPWADLFGPPAWLAASGVVLADVEPSCGWIVVLGIELLVGLWLDLAGGCEGSNHALAVSEAQVVNSVKGAPGDGFECIPARIPARR